MSKFIVPISTGDGCTWYGTEFIAVECDSAEELYVQYCEAIEAYVKMKNLGQALHGDIDRYENVELCGTKFQLSWFAEPTNYTYPYVATEIEIVPLDEWFDRQKQQDWS